MENVMVRMHGSSTALSWDSDGAHYHIWEPTPDALYKNPPNGTTYKGHGYFPTRKLNVSAKVNASMIAEAREIAQKENLYEKAAQEKLDKEQADKDAEQAASALSKKRDAAELMYSTLEKTLAALNDMTTTDFSLGKDRPIREMIREALATADGK